VCDVIDGKPSFFGMATCHAYTRVRTFNFDSMIANTCAFHFVPGCRGEGFERKLRCAEASPAIVGILTEALAGADLIRLGIALHAFADSFSHQGFSGILSRVNDINLRRSRIHMG
jgi:hypothetical protein